MIKVELNEGHKSFPGGINFTFEGELIILVGENGSGKSHICDIIKNTNLGITGNKQANVQIVDGEVVNKNNIILKSFQNNINLQPSLTELKGTVVSHVYSYLKNKSMNHEYSNAVSTIVQDLGLESDVEFMAFISNSTPMEAQKVLLKIGEKMNGYDLGKVWQQNDVFSAQNLTLIFKEYNFFREENKNTTKEAPWKIFNSLFKDLGFSYRFKNDYLGRELDNLSILKLFDTENKELNFGISDLSSGEQQIFSLIIAAYYLNHNNLGTRNLQRILILDEYDATLNPSLVDAYFKVIRKCFLDHGHKVLLTSHSTDTIYGAKKNLGNMATFYKVYKLNKSNFTNIHERIEKLEENENTYAYIVHKVFGVYSYDLHNELYGYICDVKNLYYDKKTKRSVEDFFGARVKLFKNKKLQQKIEYIKINKRTGNQNSEVVYLPTFIRHRIHHPENKISKNRQEFEQMCLDRKITEVEKNNRFTFEELRLSTDFLQFIKKMIG